MLEEALGDEKRDPGETAAAMLSFVQLELPGGGAAAEMRFFRRLYPPLCQRIFGAMTQASAEGVPDAANSENLGEGGYRHREGGWLSVQTPWYRRSPSSSASSSPMRSRSASTNAGEARRGASVASFYNSIEQDPVFRLLQTSSGRPTAEPTLIEAISKEAENRPGVIYKLPLFALPKPVRNAWLVLVCQAMGWTPPPLPSAGMGCNAAAAAVSENEERLIRFLLRTSPEHQTELQLYRQGQTESQEQRQPLRLSPVGGFNNTMMSPTVAANATSVHAATPAPSTEGSGKGGAAALASSPNVFLSVLEYYLFLFLRFPLAAPKPTQQQQQASQHAQVAPPAGLGHRVGHASWAAHSQTSRGEGNYGEAVYHSLFRRYLRHFLPYEREEGRFVDVGKSTRESELFLRIVILFWLESSLRSSILPTAIVLERLRYRMGPVGSGADGVSVVPVDLHFSYDLVQFAVPSGESGADNGRPYKPLPGLVQNCLRLLIVHLVSDPALRKRFGGGDTDIPTPVVTTKISNSGGRRSQREEPWCLSGAMTALQPHFYNYVRTAFRYASIHSQDSSFFAALNTWLIWLEPWNVVAASREHFGPGRYGVNPQRMIYRSASGERRASSSVWKLTYPKHNQDSKYRPGWEPYIAANLHLYTVPLAIFLRRARELDFGPANFDRSVQLIRRVFRVYSAAVVDAIARHLDDAEPMYSGLTRKHVNLLDPFAPPIDGASGRMSLSAFQDDMRVLLEEIHSQHQKKVLELDFFERTAAIFEGFFGAGVVSGEERALQALVERAKLIAQLPTDFEIFGTDKASSLQRNPGGTTASLAAAKEIPIRSCPVPDRRIEDARLTDEGRKQVIEGTAKCRPEDIEYVGDLMRRRAGSHDIAILVHLTIWLSDRLNESLGLLDSEGKRVIGRSFNLRFLADCRWLFFLSLLFLGIVAFELLRSFLFR